MNLRLRNENFTVFTKGVIMKEEELPIAENFSPILIEEYLRLMTAAHYIQNEDKKTPVRYEISPEYYEQVKNCPIQAPLIGMSLNYDETSKTLSVSVDEDFLHMYENKIQEEVALNFQIVNTKRYSKFIKVLD